MTTFQLNAEIFKNLSYLEDNEDYLRQALDFIKKLAHKKATAQVDSSAKKIKVYMSQPTGLEEFLPLFKHTTREDDEKAKEKYMREKYAEYL